MTRALTALRAATAVEHGRLEDRLDVLGRSRSREGYRGLLEGFWGLHVELEPRLEAARADLEVLPGWSRGAVLARLESDLDDLGCDERHRRALPRCADLPTPGTADALWGWLYVVEGAALGGGVLAAELADRPDAVPLRFFTGPGEDRGRRWHRFRLALGGWLDSDGRQDAVEQAARDAFEAFERWCVPDTTAGTPRGDVRVRSGAGAW